jgi:hypothetical protein
MKLIFTFLSIIVSYAANSQSGLPVFLHGTWKTEGQQNYEHWDTLNSSSMKGFSYSLKSGKMVVSEYLDITRRENEIHYTATVLNQNQGRSIIFSLTRNDSLFVFENPKHDFPKKIVYRKLIATRVAVEVSDGDNKGFSYLMEKQP